jgi:hypothetical protein
MGRMPFADDPTSKMIVVRFRPGGQSSRVGSSLKSLTETFFRHNLTPKAGWLILSNGNDYEEKTAVVMWPSHLIESVEVVDPTPDDRCWECLGGRLFHKTFPVDRMAGGHTFDRTPLTQSRINEVESLAMFEPMTEEKQDG